MTNLSNRVAYLTESGASRMFGDRAYAGLSIVPTEPVLVNSRGEGSVVYGDMFEVTTGIRIGGCLSEDGLSGESPGDEIVQAATTLFAEKHSDDTINPSYAVYLLGKEQDEILPLEGAGYRRHKERRGEPIDEPEEPVVVEN